MGQFFVMFVLLSSIVAWASITLSLGSDDNKQLYQGLVLGGVGLLVILLVMNFFVGSSTGSKSKKKKKKKKKKKSSSQKNTTESQQTAVPKKKIKEKNSKPKSGEAPTLSKKKSGKKASKKKVVIPDEDNDEKDSDPRYRGMQDRIIEEQEMERKRLATEALLKQAIKKEQKRRQKHQSSSDSGWTTQTSKRRGGRKTTDDQSSSFNQTQSSASTAAKNEVRLTVAQSHYGKIFGQGGSNLQKLQEVTGAKINMPKRDSNSDVIVIEGSIDAVKKAKNAVMSLVNRGFCSITHPGVNSKEVFVPPGKLGIVIGPKGSNLRAIEAATSVELNLPDRNSDKSKVVIVGTREGCLKAKDAIKSLLAYGYSDLTHPDFIRDEIPFPRDSLALLIGPRGTTIKSIQGNTKTKINIPDANDINQNVIVVGPSHGVKLARKAILKLLETPVFIPQEEDDEEYWEGP